MIERICIHCGNAYKTYPSIRLRFCSSACAGAAKKNGVSIPCRYCQKPFYKHPCRPNAAFCSKSCARSSLNRTEANPSFRRDVSGEKNPMHGKGMVGPDNPMHGKRKELSPRWNKGKKLHAAGYVMVVVPDDHPHPSHGSKSGTKYLLEHRFVMEQHLGRYLVPGEVVHHIDGNRANNAINNLQLFSSHSEHIINGHRKRKDLEEENAILKAEVERLQAKIEADRR